MGGAIIVEDVDSDSFHRRVLEMESQGFQARQETYRIIAEMNPAMGRITHVYRIEMVPAEESDK